MRTRTSLLCLLCILLSACGGGGGGDGGAVNNNPPPPPPPPPFALTEANAVQAAAYALAPIEQLLPAGTLGINAAGYLIVTRYPQVVIGCGTASPVQIAITYADRDASGDVSVGDILEVPGIECDGLTRKITLTLTEVSAALDVIAGRAQVDLLANPPGMRVVGAFDISLNLKGNERTWHVTNAMVTVTQANTTQTLRLASGRFTFTPTTYSFSLSGGSVESEHLGGNYTFATTTPLEGDLRRLPSSGELMLSAAAGSRVRITPPATAGTVEEAVEYAVAATGTAFGPTQPTVWTAIIRGLLFTWRPNVAPTLTDLQIQPQNPSPGSPLWIYYNAYDANGDTLQTTIEWRHNGTVVGNAHDLYIQTVRNDQISVTVTVSDGRLTATATTSITIGNPPPLLTLTLTPPQPDTTVDLVATPTVHEPDGDPVTTTFEWRRNGTIIAGRTGSVLPASETTRNDTISVRVTASDGSSTVEATASTTIVDSPPRLTVSSPPTTVAHGAPVEFTATVSDADGDPVEQLDYVLAYGPAGMTVDADTGEVDWIAGGPMFDREMNVSWGVTVTGPLAEIATGSLKVTDPERDYPLLRFGPQIPTWPAGLSVGNFDDDSDVEMLVMGQRWLFELESDHAGGYRQAWAYPYSLNADTQYSYNASKVSVATGDVDGDGKHEIFAAVGRTITKLDGIERRPTATRQLTDTYAACNDLLYGDVENDGAPELLCLEAVDFSTSSRIVVLRASDLSVRHEFPQANYGRTFVLGNVDTDSALEIVTAAGYVFDGATLTNQWLYPQGFGNDVDTGDLDGDGVDEIVGAEGWTYLRGFTTRGPPTAPISPIWEVSHSHDLASLLLADVGGDARPEVLVGDGQWGNVTVYRYNTATNGVDVIGQINSQDHGVTSIGAGDVDDDGELEVIWGSGMSSSGADVLVVAGLDPMTVEWTNADPLQLDGPFRGGMLAGSATAPRAPLFLSLESNSGYDGSRLVRMPSDGGALEVSNELASNWAGTGALDVVDYDGNGTEEAFVATNVLYDGLFTVYDFFGAASKWSSPLLQHQATQDVTHGDLTGDGKAELIGLSSNGVIYAHNFHEQSLVWQSTTLGSGRRVLAVDMDGDSSGELEIVAVGLRNVYVYHRNAPPIPYLQSASYQTTRDIIDADIGDMDGDGDPEVVLVMGEWYSSTGSEVVTLNADLQPEAVGSFTLPWQVQTLDIEPSSALRKNLLVSRLVGDSANSAIAIVGGRSGGVVFESPALIGIVQRDSVHYVTLPGETEPRISIGTSNGMYLTR